MGILPSAETDADPQWVPYRIGAGRSIDADPRERHLEALRRLTFDGKSARASWHPDSRHIVFESYADGGCGQIVRMDLGSGRVEQLTKTPGAARAATFAGERVIYAHSPKAQPPCSSAVSLLGWPQTTGDLRAHPLDGGSPSALFPDPAHDGAPSASPDGTQLVFSSTRDGDPEIYLADLGAQTLRRITEAPGYDAEPRFSPDGTKIVWQAHRPSPSNIVIAAADAAADDAPEVTAAPAPLRRPETAPATTQIAIAGAHGQHPRLVTPAGNRDLSPTFLHDSRRILFASDLDADPNDVGLERNFELYIVDPDAPPGPDGQPTRQRVSYHDGFDGQPQLSPDGRYLLFTSSRQGESGEQVDLSVARWVED